MDPQPLILPAWWDPKSRKWIVDDSTIVCGVLVVGRSTVAFASPAGVEFDLPADGVRLSWSGWGTRCRLHGSSTYLLYLAPPTEGSPRLSRDAVLEIAGRLTTANDLGDFAELVTELGDLGDVIDVAGALGNAVKAYSSITALRVARRSHHALAQRFAPAA